MSSFTIAVLGALKLSGVDRPTKRLETSKAQALLAYLVLESHQPHSRSHLAGLLWPNQPEKSARQNLRQTLYRIRQALQRNELLIQTRQTIQFNSEMGSQLTVDAHLLREAVHYSSQHAHTNPYECHSCSERLEAGLKHYRGELLEGLEIADSPAFELWLTSQRTWFRKQATVALQWLTQHYMGACQWQMAHKFASKWCALEPLDETAHRQLMQCSALDGQRNQAISHYESLRNNLDLELGLLPEPETERLFHQIIQGEFNTLVAKEDRSAKINIPPLPPLTETIIGREQIVTTVIDLLQQPETRLLTVSGFSGIGKTTVALQAAHQFQTNTSNCVGWVSANSEDGSLENKLSRYFGLVTTPVLSTAQQLRQYLQEHPMLLVLDGVHCNESDQQFLGDLLRVAPQLSLLVTSHRPLDIAGERRLHLDGLSNDEAHALFQYYAAQSKNPTLNGAGIERISQALGGHPLLLRLAAGWTRLYDTESLAQKLENEPDFPLGVDSSLASHHQSVEQLMHNGWRLLSAEMRNTLYRLSIFKDTFTASTVEQICGVDAHQLMQLLDVAWLRQANGEARFNFPPLVRQFLDQQPYSNGQIREQFLAHYLEKINEFGSALYGKKQTWAVQQINAEWRNIICAWQYALETQDVAFIQTTLPTIARYCDMTCQFEQAITLFRTAAEHELILSTLRATLYGFTARFMGVQSNRKEAYSLMVKQMDVLANRPDNGLKVTLALAFAQLATELGELDSAENTLNQIVNEWVQPENLGDVAATLMAGGVLAYRQGDLDRAYQCLNQSLSTCRALGDWWQASLCHEHLGEVRIAQTNYDAARYHFEEMLRLHEAIGAPLRIAHAQRYLADLAQRQKDNTSADYYLTICYDQYIALKQWRSAVVSLVQLGQLATDRQDAKMALHHWQTGLRLAMRHGLQSLMITLLKRIGVLIEMAPKSTVWLQQKSDLQVDDLLRQFSQILQYASAESAEFDSELTNLVTNTLHQPRAWSRNHLEQLMTTRR